MVATKEEMKRLLEILRRPMVIRPDKADSSFIDRMEAKMSASQIKRLPTYAKRMLGI